MRNTISIRLDKNLAEWLERTANQTGVSQGMLVREQLERAREAKPDRPFMRWRGAISGARNLSQRKGFSRK